MKKNSCTPINPKKYSCNGLNKIHAKNLITKKNSCSSKIPYPPHNFSNGPSLRQRYCSWVYTAISRKVVAKNVHATIPKGNIYFFFCFPLALTKILPWPFVPFFQISLKNSIELKTTHNIFRDCRD